MGYIFVYQWTTGVAILGKEAYYCLEIFGFFKPYLYIVHYKIISPRP